MVRFLAYKCRHRGRQEFSTSMGAACCREYPPLQIRSYHQLLCVHRLFYALKACRLSRCPPNPVPKSKDRRLLHLFSAFLIRSIIRTRLFNDYLGSLTNTPVIQRLPQPFNDYNATESYNPPKTHETPPRNCLQRGSLMCRNRRKALFQAVFGRRKSPP